MDELVYSAAKRGLSAVRSWLARWWKYVLAGFAVLLAYLIGKVPSPKPQTPPPPPVPPRIDVDPKVLEALDKLRKDEEAKAAAIAEKANAERAENVDTVKVGTKAVQDNLDASNKYVTDVGKSMREP